MLRSIPESTPVNCQTRRDIVAGCNSEDRSDEFVVDARRKAPPKELVVAQREVSVEQAVGVSIEARNNNEAVIIDAIK